MIRDGLSLKKKRIVTHGTEVDKAEYTENLLSSVINAQKKYVITKIAKNFAYIKDPYGILLLMEPTGVPLDGDQYLNGAEYPQITCKEYYEGIKNGKIDEILPKMTAEEKIYCNIWSNEKNYVSSIEILRAIAYDMDLDWNLIRENWEFQPSPEAFAFGLTSKRILIESITPVLGIPYVMITPSDYIEKIRFPIAVSVGAYMDEYTHVQIHKEGNDIEVWTDTDESIYLDPITYKQLRQIGVSFVAEGYFDKDSKLKISDLLCWNDIWLYRRPLSERLKLLWHFHPFRESVLVAYNQSELDSSIKEFNGKVLVRNLNRSYIPSDRSSHIFINRASHTCMLRVGGRRGGKSRAFLNTADKKSVYQIPVEIEKEDWGDIVEVDRNGKVIRIVENGIPDSWSTVAKHFELEIDYEVYKEGILLPECEWIKEVQ